MDSYTARVFLVRVQADEGLTSKAMAERLGMSRSNWCHVRKGRRALAPAQILRACALYPALRELLFSEERAS